MEIKTIKEKIQELEIKFLEEYPIFWRRIWIEHFCKFFWISRQTLYKPESTMNSKRNKINRKSFTNEKFLKFLLSYK